MNYQIAYDANIDCWYVYEGNTVLVSVMTEQEAQDYVARNRALVAAWQASSDVTIARYLHRRDD